MGRGKGVGALEFSKGLMVVVYGGVLVKGGKVLLSICLLLWGMVLVFFFGMTNGLGMSFLKFFIPSYFCVLPINKLMLLKC